jgi:hypothetical protein
MSIRCAVRLNGSWDLNSVKTGGQGERKEKGKMEGDHITPQKIRGSIGAGVYTGFKSSGGGGVPA